MVECPEQWIPTPEAIRALAKRAGGSAFDAADLLAGWFFDERVRLKATEISVLMPQEFLDEPHFFDGEPDEERTYRELHGHSHASSELLRRRHLDVLINPASLNQDSLSFDCPIWKTGELFLSYGGINPEAKVIYYGVTVSESDIHRCAALLPRPADSPIKEAAGQSTAVGRRPANWWPDFARELAIEIHENGLPETQEALIAKVQSTITSQGKEEPSRAQIQPVIKSIFTRLGQAGK